MDSQREVEILHRINALERKVDQLMRAGGADPAEGWGFGDEPDLADASDLLGLVQSGNKIEAIQRYRERTGVGLKQAKDVVDRLESGD
jgi:large subunit ribosomal protein L7/L12